MGKKEIVKELEKQIKDSKMKRIIYLMLVGIALFMIFSLESILVGIIMFVPSIIALSKKNKILNDLNIKKAELI